MNKSITNPVNKLSVKTRIIIILGILAVFILTATAVSIGLFIKAESISSDAQILNQAVTESSSIAETLKASDGNMDKAAGLLRTHQIYEITADSFILYYDENFQPSAKSGSSYEAVVTKKEQNEYRSYTINIFCLSSVSKKSDASSAPVQSNFSENKGKPIYKLSFKAINKGGV